MVRARQECTRDPCQVVDGKKIGVLDIKYKQNVVLDIKYIRWEEKRGVRYQIYQISKQIYLINFIIPG